MQVPISTVLRYVYGGVSTMLNEAGHGRASSAITDAPRTDTRQEITQTMPQWEYEVLDLNEIPKGQVCSMSERCRVRDGAVSSSS
jgi:hypothetical protein